LIPASNEHKTIANFTGVGDTGNASLGGVNDTGNANIASVVDTGETSLSPHSVRQSH
jgi:hypothetical protein